jgi:cytoskeletal protein CcmA (bactofilin family)
VASARPPAWFDQSQAPRRTASGYWIPGGSLLPSLHTTDATRQIVIGPDVHITGDLDAAGRLSLTRGVRIDGMIRGASDVTLGPGCHVRGAIECGGRLVVQNSRVDAQLKATGDVLLLGACRVGLVQAGGDILVSGKPKTGRLEPGGRVSARPW